MSKTITVTDEQFEIIKSTILSAEKVEEKKKKTIIYKTDGSVLHESDKETVKEAVIEADLYGADLYEADLREADLYGVNLREAELREAKFYGKGGTVELKQSQVEDFLSALGFVVKG